MGLADYFRRLIPDDPYVQSGVMSRGQNWDMKLGSLAAAFGHMDRGGMLGQTLAQAGAIYQDQRRGALADAIARAQDEAKAQREEEVYRQKQADYEYELEERDRLAMERKQKAEDAFNERKANQYALHGLGLDPSLADASPSIMGSAINEAELGRRPKEPKTGGGYQAVPESGRVYRTNPETGEPEIFNFGAAPGGGSGGKLSASYVDALVRKYPQHEAIIRANPESFATQAAQSVFDSGPAGPKPADERKDFESRIKDVQEDGVWVDQFAATHGDRQPDYADYVTEATRRRSIVTGLLSPPKFTPGTSGLETIRRGQAGAAATRDRVIELRGGTKTVKPQGGEPVAGMHMPPPKQSSPAAGKMGLLRGTPKRTEAQATGIARLESVVETAKTVLPPAQAAALGPVIKRMTDEGIDPEEIAAYIERRVQMVSAGGR